MNKVLIVIMFILLGTSLIVLSNMNKGVENSYTIEYHNNKNLSLPHLTEEMEILPGLYRYRTQDGITMDYNIYNGNIILNGTRITGTDDLYLGLYKNIIPNGSIVTFTYQYISGTINHDTLNIHLFPNSINTPSPTMLKIGNEYTQKIINQNYQFEHNINNSLLPRLYLRSGTITFDNFTFRVQLEKGSQATTYVVPKLIPVYKDNLTLDEKQEIGFGAFAGFTEIIRNINGFIKPIGDFINGILSWF